MKQFKYVICKVDGIEQPILCAKDGGITHRQMSIGTPVSAGFCYLNENDVTCFGESVSLEIKSRMTIDDAILKRFFYEYY